MERAPGLSRGSNFHRRVFSPPGAANNRRFSSAGPSPTSELLPKVRERLQGRDGARVPALLLPSAGTFWSSKNGEVADRFPDGSQRATVEAGGVLLFQQPKISSFSGGVFLASHPTSLGMPRPAAGVHMCGN